MTSKTVVVLGAGQSGCQLVSSLAEEGFDGHIVLVGDEPHPPYQRPPLSKAHLTGTGERGELWLRPAAWFAGNGVELLLGTAAESIDLAAASVRLSGGQAIGYDHLVLALGSRHRVLPIEGTDLDGVVSLRTLDEADDLRARLERARRVVIVGGGFIGMEVAATAARLGKQTTVVETASQLMGRVLSSATAEFLRQAHAERGLTIELSSSVRALSGAGGLVTGVEIADGRRLPADLVLIGVGALPNTELAAAAGLAVADGVVVDEYLRTSDPNVYAIGDCARSPNLQVPGPSLRLESVQNASAQARCVAAALIGRPEPYRSVPWFWSDQADLKIQIAGLTAGHDEVLVKGDLATTRFSVYCFAQGRLLGVESVNRPADHIAARRLLAARGDVTPAEVGEEGFDPKAAARLATARRP
jgi:3-phenylpropionate/trans-cinnamate dioxygenase ferredoxin reductase subunit